MKKQYVGMIQVPIVMTADNLKDAQKLAAAISANLGYCVFTAGKSGECYGRNKVLNVKLKRKTA